MNWEKIINHLRQAGLDAYVVKGTSYINDALVGGSSIVIEEIVKGVKSAQVNDEFTIYEESGYWLVSITFHNIPLAIKISKNIEDVVKAIIDFFELSTKLSEILELTEAIWMLQKNGYATEVESDIALRIKSEKSNLVTHDLVKFMISSYSEKNDYILLSIRLDGWLINFDDSTKVSTKNLKEAVMRIL